MTLTSRSLASFHTQYKNFDEQSLILSLGLFRIHSELVILFQNDDKKDYENDDSI